MKGKVLFVNPASRLAAAYIGVGRCVVFEYKSTNHFKVGEMLDNLRDSYGHAICERMDLGKRASVQVLSAVMTRGTAELIVAPWRDSHRSEFPMEEYAYA